MKIFYVQPTSDTPTGGIKQAFRHVEALQSEGYDAHILLDRPSRPAWFESTASIAYPDFRSRLSSSLRRRDKRYFWHWLRSSSVPPVVILSPAGAGGSGRGIVGKDLRHRISPEDVLVFPEFFGSQLPLPPWPARIGIFNQNAHYTFSDDTYDSIPRLGAGLYARAEFVLCVSDHSYDYLSYTFPQITVVKTLNGVDIDRFSSSTDKRHQIAFMPRKLGADAIQAFNILHSRRSLEGWEIVPIDGMPEVRVAETLRHARVFLSTCEEEGFGLPPLEAAAAGCSVVGYTGYGAAEFMRPEFCKPVTQGDVLALAKTLAEVVEEHNQLGSVPMTGSAQAHRRFVEMNYSLECQQKSVVEAWQRVLQP